jgi:CDP-glucose 4,6-dehydratase
MAGERQPDPDFWRGRSIFITGHTGFVGGWLALWLARMGAHVTGYALSPPTEPCFFDCIGLDRFVASTLGDVRDSAHVAQAIASARPQVIFHLAAQPLVGLAFEEPYATFATNVLGTANVLEAAYATASIDAVVVFTTDKVYAAAPTPHRFQEDDPLGGSEPYALSKASAEFAAHAFRNSRRALERPNLALATMRAGNIVGGGDWAADRLVPDAMRAFQAGRPLVLRKPDAVRPWQFVLDAVSGLLLLTEEACRDPQIHSQSWNFGPIERATTTVATVADALARHWGDSAFWRAAVTPGIPETMTLEIDSSKAVKRLGWQPRWPLDAALAQTVSWYRAFYAGENMLDTTSQKIDDYCSSNGTNIRIARSSL